MAKDAKQQANSTFNTTNQDQSQLNGRGASTFNAMFPTLQQNAAGTQGMTQAQINNANTAGQQSIGGSNAGIVGQGNLTAGRTGNPGSMISAIGSAARGNAKNLAQGALGVQELNSNIAMQKQQAALGELGKLYGTNVQGLNEMLGNQNNAVKNVQTADQTGFQDAMQVWDEANKTGATVATAM